MGVDCTGNFFRKKAIEKTNLRILRPSAFSHSLGQKLTSAPTIGMSDLPPIADIVRPPRHVRKVPKGDMLAKARTQRQRGACPPACRRQGPGAPFGLRMESTMVVRLCPCRRAVRSEPLRRGPRQQ